MTDLPQRPPRPTFVRKDDHQEKVQITSQERCPNGVINFVFVEPQSAAGATSALTSTQFYEAYYDPEAVKKPWPPERPSSLDNQKAWREYALYLETEVARIKASKSIFSQTRGLSHDGGLRP